MVLMTSCLLLSSLPACQKMKVGVPPPCPKWTDAEFLEAEGIVRGGEYPATVNRMKRLRRYCEAIDVMRD